MAREPQEILTVIKEHLEGRGVPPDKVVLGADLSRDLDLDSLDTMELTLGIEQRFGIEIPDSDLEALATVGDAVDLVQKKLAVSA